MTLLTVMRQIQQPPMPTYWRGRYKDLQLTGCGHTNDGKIYVEI